MFSKRKKKGTLRLAKKKKNVTCVQLYKYNFFKKITAIELILCIKALTIYSVCYMVVKISQKLTTWHPPTLSRE